MFETMALPVWLVVLGAVLAAWAVVGYAVLPALRWLLRRRSERVFEEVNTRLQLSLSPFSLTKRRVLADRLAHDPKVLEAVAAAAEQRGVPRNTVMKEVRSCAREIVPAFSPYFYFHVGYWAARALLRFLYRVRLGYADEVNLAKVRSEDSVVFVMNHRTNVDYMVVSYLASSRTALSYGVGDWARTWPIQQMMRAAGAYFLRRDSGNAVYRRVLERYVQMATEARVPHAIFPEGALSRDGGLAAPKMGLLSYVTRTFRLDGPHDIVFIPIGTNYDRIPEEQGVLGASADEYVKKGAGFVLISGLRFAGQLFRAAVTGKSHAFGYACANFGTPVSLRAWLRGRGIDPADDVDGSRRAWVGELGRELMDDIEALIPVLPVSVLAQVFTQAADGDLGRRDLKRQVGRIMDDLMAAGAHTYIPKGDEYYAFAEGLDMLIDRGLVVEKRGRVYAAKSDARPVLAYYARSIAHFLPADAQQISAAAQ